MEQAFKAVKMGILTWVLMGILIIYCLHYSFIICMHVEDFQLNACRHQTVQTVCSHNKIPCSQPPLTLFLLAVSKAFIEFTSPFPWIIKTFADAETKEQPTESKRKEFILL